MGDIVYCPRDQTPSIKIEGENFAMCASCGHSFCTFCYNASHGSRPCKFTGAEIEKAASQFEEAKKENDSEKIKELEKRYGQDLGRKIDEMKSLKLIQQTSMRCPKCSEGIQKSDGCNKMTCSKCKCYFCYICGEILHPDAPYTHYQQRSSPCYGQLFLGLDDADEQQDLFDMFF